MDVGNSRMLTTVAVASNHYEQDDDFIFTRTSKRAKPSAEPEPEPEQPPKKAVGRPRQTAAKKRALSPVEQEARPPPAASKKTTRRSSANGSKSVAQSQQDDDDDDELAVPKTRLTPRSARSSLEEQTDEAALPTKAKGRNPRKRDISPVDTPAGPALNHLEREISHQRDDDRDDDDAEVDKSDSRQIALPISDTPVIARNKELRKNGGQRRSSLGMRGRRASNLIENGHIAAPHREVDAAEFYKHIEAEGLSEPRRMMQLLTWCGNRSLVEKPKHGSENSNAVLGGTYDGVELSLHWL